MTARAHNRRRVDLRQMRIDSIDALVQAQQVTLDVYRFTGRPKPKILNVLVSRTQLVHLKALIARQCPLNTLPDIHPMTLRWNGMDISCPKPHATLVEGHWEAEPVSTDPEDLMAAHAAEKLLNGLRVSEVP